MAEKKYYWLKLQNDFFSSKRIKKLRKLGSDFVIIYLKMQLLSLQNNGLLEYTGIEDTFSDELALDIDEDADKVQLTISYLQSCGLLEVTDDNEFFLPYVEKCTGSASDEEKREQWRIRQQRHREKLALESDVTQMSHKCHVTMSLEKEIEKDKDKEIEIDKEKESKKEKEVSSAIASEAPTKPQKETKHQHGEYQHVLLTDKEYAKLAEDFGTDVREDAIKFLDEYIEEKGYKSKSHNMAIRRWVIEAVVDRKTKQRKGNTYIDTINNRVNQVDDWV